LKRAPFFEIHIPETMTKLKNHEVVTDFKDVYDFCDFIDTREDCNDFRMISLQRLYLQFGEFLSEELKERIKKTMLHFRYWMTEPGDDNMCYWSENHQILFATIEYTSCLLFPEEKFSNSNELGKEKIEYAMNRILHWMQKRFSTGFIEWHSHVYYAEDLAALMHLIDFSKNPEIVKKTEIITDLMFLDMAMHSFKGNFALTHGRSYERQKKTPRDADISPILSDAFGITSVPYFESHISSIFSYRMNYQIPSIIKEIALDQDTVIIKDQMGYDLKTVHDELNMNNSLDRFVLWQMESFTNPEAINDTMDMLNEYKMFSNEFLSSFKSISAPILRKLGLLPIISKILRPVSDGVAIQQANTYTYKTKDYSLSTAVHHYPGTPGDQQHIMNCCLSDELNLFITHPAVLPYDDENMYLSLSPNEWVGNGRMPDSRQYENVNFTMFQIGKHKGFMEKVLMDYTHAFFPTNRMEEHTVEDHYAFVSSKDANVAFISRNKLKLKKEEELIQEGRDSAWILEVSSKSEENFEEFKKRIKENKVIFHGKEVDYVSKNKHYHLTYDKDFKVDNQLVPSVFKRMDSPYVLSSRYPNEYIIHYHNRELKLNLNEFIRLQSEK